MNQSWSRSKTGIRLFSVLAISSAIFATNNCTFAQIVPDNTLGSESSTTAPDPQFPIDLIEGGATRGANLFHSFSEFNVSEGRGAYFFSPSADIQNILARITGGNPSTILGTIGTYGNSIPNLFLINPNGIIFGQNASLDIGNAGVEVGGTGGSFVATTANAVILGETGVFSASNSSASNLLNIAPSALFFNGNSPAEIVDRSSATTSVLGFGISGLQVPNARSLILAGGNITLDNGILYVPSGNIELAGVTKGTVGLNIAGNKLSLSYPDSVQPADILLTNNSLAAVLSSDGGSITINARNINILAVSGLFAGIEPGGDSIQDAGDITLKASENIVIAGNNDSSSLIFNAVAEGAIGNSGDIYLQAESIFLNNSLLTTNTQGQGNGGNVIIQANNSVAIDNNSLISSEILFGGVGKGGNIDIQAGSLSLKNSILGTSISGEGDAGSVFIQANNVALDRGSILSNNLGNFASVLIGDGTEIALGNGGNIQIVTGSLSLNNNSVLVTSTSGLGNAGNVFISATDLVSLTGDSDIFSGVLSSTILDIEGLDGELIDIIGAAAVGNGGDISIEARSLLISGESLLFTYTSGLGDAGNVSIQTNEAVAITDSRVSSGVVNNAFLGFVGVDTAGQGGDLSIVADSLSVDNATLSTSTTGRGSAGSIFLQARDIFLTNNSQVSSAVEQGGVGEAGAINLETNSLYLTGGSQIRAAVERERDNLPGGQGKGGNIQINASETVDISGVNGNGFSSTISTSSDRGASGQAGNIIVNTSNFRIADGAVVNALTANSSNAGSITINANNFTATGGGQVLTTTSSSGNAGSINLNIANKIDLNGSDPTLATRQAQFGTGIVTNQSPSSGLFANTALGSTGSGGSIFVNSQEFNISENAGVSVDSQGQGNAGNLQVQANSISLDRSAFISATTASGEGGDVNIQAEDLLLLRRNSNITTAAGGTGNGGNIKLDTRFIVAPASEDSNIIADAIAGNGGNINITAQGIFGIASRPRQTPQSDITASSELGINGEIAINNPDVDPVQGLVALPGEIIDATSQIASGCNSNRQRVATNKFVVTGRGGLPANPGNTLTNDAVLTDWAVAATENKNATQTSYINKQLSTPIVEAQGWIIDDRGHVVLTAQAPQITPNSSKLITTCNGT